MGKPKKKKLSGRAHKPGPVKHFTQDDVFMALFNGGEPPQQSHKEYEELPANYQEIWTQMACFRSVAKSWIPLEDLDSLEQRKEAMVHEIRELLRQRLLEKEALKKKLVNQAKRRAMSEDANFPAPVIAEEPEKSQWEVLLDSLGGLFGHNRDVMIAEGLLSPNDEDDGRSRHNLGQNEDRGHIHNQQISVVTDYENGDAFGGPETLPGGRSRLGTANTAALAGMGIGKGSGSFLTEEDAQEAEHLSDHFRRQLSQGKAISRKPSFASGGGLSRDMSLSDYGVGSVAAAAEVAADPPAGSVGVSMGASGGFGRDRTYSSGLGLESPDTPAARPRTKSGVKDHSQPVKHSHAPVLSKANQEAKLLILTSEDYLPSLWAGLLKKPERAKVAALARFRLAELARREREEAEAKALADAAAAQALIDEEERQLKEEADAAAALLAQELEAEAARKLAEAETEKDRARVLLLEKQAAEALAARQAALAARVAGSEPEPIPELVKPKSHKRAKSISRKGSTTKKKVKDKARKSSTLHIEEEKVATFEEFDTDSGRGERIPAFSVPPSRADSPETAVAVSQESSLSMDDEDEEEKKDGEDDNGRGSVALPDAQVQIQVPPSRRLESRGGLATAPTMSRLVRIVDQLFDHWTQKYIVRPVSVTSEIVTETEIAKATAQDTLGTNLQFKTNKEPSPILPDLTRPRELILQYVLGFNPHVDEHFEWYQQSLRSMDEAGVDIDETFDITLGFSQGQFAMAPEHGMVREPYLMQIVISRPPTVNPDSNANANANASSVSGSRVQSSKVKRSRECGREVLRMKSREMSYRNDTAPCSLDQESLIGLNPRYSPSHTAISADNQLYTRGGSLAGSDIAMSSALAASSIGAYSASMHGSGSYMNASHATYSPLQPNSPQLLSASQPSSTQSHGHYGRQSHGPQTLQPALVSADQIFHPATNSALSEFYNFSDDAPLMVKIAADMEICAAENHADVMEQLRLSQAQQHQGQQTQGEYGSLSMCSPSTKRRGLPKRSQEPVGFAVPVLKSGGANTHIFPELLSISCDYSAAGILTMTSVMSKYQSQDAMFTEQTDVLSYDSTGIHIPQLSPDKSKRHRHLRKQQYCQLLQEQQRASASIAFDSTMTDPLTGLHASSSSSNSNGAGAGAGGVNATEGTLSMSTYQPSSYRNTAPPNGSCSTASTDITVQQQQSSVGRDSSERKHGFSPAPVPPAPSHPYARRARTRTRSSHLSIDEDGSDSDSAGSLDSLGSMGSLGSYNGRKLSHGVYFDLMSDGEGAELEEEVPDDYSRRSDGTERLALSNNTTVALLNTMNKKHVVQSPVVPFPPKHSHSSQSAQRRKRFTREKNPRALVKTCFTPYPIHKKGLDQKDISLEWDPLTAQLNLVATFSKTISQVPPAFPISTSILNSSLPRRSQWGNGNENKHISDGKEVQEIRVSLADVHISPASEISRSVTGNIRSVSYSVSKVPFHYANYAYNQTVAQPENDMLVLRSPRVPGEYITSIRAAEFQHLLRNVENNIIVAAAVDAANVSFAMTREARELEHKETIVHPRCIPPDDANEFIEVKRIDTNGHLWQRNEGEAEEDGNDSSQQTPHIFIPRINADRLTPFNRGRSRGQSGRPKPSLISLDL